MKLFPLFSASVVLTLAGCNTGSGPLSSSGFDPLLPPGSGNRFSNSGPAFKAGDLARAIMDNTYFYRQLPKANAEANKTLLRGTGMKVAEVAGSYLKVELDVTGEVGYVPTVMVENTSNQAPTGIPPAYAPLPGGEENLDPAVPPGGIIPPIQDPGLPGIPTPGIGSSPPPLPTAPGVAPTPDPVLPVVPQGEIPGVGVPAAPGGTPPP